MNCDNCGTRVVHLYVNMTNARTNYVKFCFSDLPESINIGAKGKGSTLHISGNSTRT